VIRSGTIRTYSSTGADALLMLTDVAGVEADFGTGRARLLERLTVAQARAMPLPAGSMGPKVEAACRFAETGGLAAIGRLGDALLLLGGNAGTLIAPR
jgi:carbamate kinase